MRLSALDQSVSLAGGSEDAAIRDTLSLAEHCERLGYARFWLSEHHGLPTIVGSAPEILMAAIAARTTRDSHRQRRRDAAALQRPQGGRAVPGAGGARPGPDRPRRRPRAGQRHADRARPQPERQPRRRGLPGAGARPPCLDRRSSTHAGITAHPLGPHAPEIWILGSSDYGAQLAAHFGLPYAFAYFFTDGQGAEVAMDLYRQRFQPSERHPRP